MQQPTERDGSRRPATFALCALAGAVALLAYAIWRVLTPALASEPPRTPTVQPPAPTPVEPEAIRSLRKERFQATQPPPQPSPPKDPITAAQPMSFSEAIAQLSMLGLRVAEHARNDEIKAATEADQQARECLTDLMGRFDDAGERALDLVLAMASGTNSAGQPTAPETGALADADTLLAKESSMTGAGRTKAGSPGSETQSPGEPPPALRQEIEQLTRASRRPSPATPQPVSEIAKLAVLKLVIQADLARRHDTARAHGEAAPRDSLVQALLDSMPVAAMVGEAGDACLHRLPYLQLAHEPTVRQLLSLAANGEFSQVTARHMLETLWDNLKATGERSGGDLKRLALVMLDGGNAAEQATACRELLADARYRGIAIAWIRQKQDQELAATIAQGAATELPPDVAIQVLRELSPLIEHMRGLYLSIGTRSPEVVADAYRQHLADDTQPNIRSELLMGVAMLPGKTGLELAQLALTSDPAASVRMQALFAITANATAEQAEMAIYSLLDDDQVAMDPLQLGGIVLALGNIEHSDPNCLQRVGARLNSLPLQTQDRERLAAMLARGLPGGG